MISIVSSGTGTLHDSWPILLGEGLVCGPWHGTGWPACQGVDGWRSKDGHRKVYGPRSMASPGDGAHSAGSGVSPADCYLVLVRLVIATDGRTDLSRSIRSQSVANLRLAVPLHCCLLTAHLG